MRLILAVLAVFPAAAVERQTLRGHVPLAVARVQSTGPLAGTTPLRLAIGLPLRQRENLTNLLQRLYNPASADYRRFLTTQEFIRRFGPAEKDYQALLGFARSNGLEVVGTHPNRLLLDVRAAVADVERTFRVKMRTYAHPTEERLFYAPDVEPSLETHVPILHVAGFDDYVQPQSMSRISSVASDPRAAGAPRNGSGRGGTFLGNDFRNAYVPGSGLTGSGQAVGLFELNGYYASDIAAYKTLAGLPDVPLSNVLIDGFSGAPGGRRPGSANEEVALDIEMALSMAPGLSQIVVYEGSPTASLAVIDDILNRMATDNLAKQLSCSWGFDIDVISQQIFQQYAAQGQSFFLASGDSGAFSGPVAQPTDNPYVTVVGGTVLTTDSSKAWAAETAWNGSSGGTSTVVPIPTWQENLDMSANRGSTVMRNTPDVAMVADNVQVIADRGRTIAVSGTSIAAPLWAGFMALVNEQAAAAGKPPVGFLNPALYAIGRSPDATRAYHDIVSGNNTNASSPTLYRAVAGYDLCTGWGTPNGTNFIAALLGLTPANLVVNPAVGFIANGPVGGPFDPRSRSYTLSNSGNTPVDWALLNLPAWLDASARGGTIAPGSPPTVVTVSLNAGASSLLVGASSATTLFTNVAGTGAQELEFALLVGNAGFETSDFTAWDFTGSSDANFADSVDASFWQGGPTIPGVDDSLFVHSGIFGAFLGQTNSLGSLSQTLPTQAGGRYVVSFWLTNPAQGTPNEFQASWDGGSLVDLVDADQFGWTNYQYVVTASSTSTVLQFGFQNDQNAFGLDDISVQAVAAPVIQTIGQTNGLVTLTWSAVSGLSYAVEMATDLSQPTWISLTNGIATGIQGAASVPGAPTTAANRFFRVVQQVE